MSDILKVVITAVVQGLTEFLPVSSSAHVVWARTWLSLPGEGADLEVVLHAGTLLAVVAYYRAQILELVTGVFRRDGASVRYCRWLVLASIPAAVVYAFLHEWIESCFGAPRMAGLLLGVTGLGLLCLRLTEGKTGGPLTGRSVAVMGIAQALALLPGISRSGATILAGRLTGGERRAVVDFTLLMSVVAIGGAVIVKIPHLVSGTMSVGLVALGTGVLVAAGVGYGAIIVLVRLLQADRLWWLGYYCLAVGGLAASGILI